MNVFIQPASEQEQTALSETELVTITVAGERHVLKKATSSNTESPSTPSGTLSLFFYQPVEEDVLLDQFQHIVKATLVRYRNLIYALYTEFSFRSLSYYILLENDTLDIQQTILSNLYAWPIDELRRHILPVYYIFLPKEQESLLSELVAIKL